MDIRIDDLNSPEVISLISEHLASMAPTAPAESRHALDLEGLRGSNITFWAVWDGSQLAGIGALKRLSREHGEIKSMRTAKSYLGQGVASRLLSHIVDEAKKNGYVQLSLETGSMDYFEPARKLYASFDFKPCPPLEDYVEDPNSVFMTKHIA
ncbi:GNAT family N-acetyltransferase [Halomonas sp. PAMB 3264]|uniref:GNAT family N-acetyltransferase n=1 Tax=unclassified Halomonas TaxID=2609666 RepID=UPI00289E1ED0|nr:MULTISPECIES: GNAT family N-acetyltransferase [unclassified Halomonas]WNL38095.1 GNAT family N-acetyltransferase [Halomonas sp. PAMB 3232]WNL41421.1 GNAT family N-acetyltransferase [Halomonas sp. PAMB 3264]